MGLRHAASTVSILIVGLVVGLAACSPTSPDPSWTPIPTAEPWSGPSTPLEESLTRHDGAEGYARVSATWLTPEYLRLHPGSTEFDPSRYLIFRVVVDSPDLAKMSAWDLKGMIYLREESGKEYATPQWRPIAEGARKVGMAAFPNRDGRDNPVPGPGSRYLELVIRDLAGARERVLRWDLSP